LSTEGQDATQGGTLEIGASPDGDERAAPDVLDSAAAGPSVIRGGLLRIGGYAAGTLLAVLSVSLLNRHLGIPGYGRYAVVIGLVTLVQGITDIGLGQIGVREFAIRHGGDRARLLRNLLGIRVFLTTVGVALAVAYAAVAGYGGSLVLGTLFAGVGMVLTVIQGTFAIPLAAELRLGWVTAMDLLRQLLTVTAIVLLVVAGAKLLAFLAVSVPVAIGVLVATLVLVRRAMPLKASFDRAEWITLMRSVLPFAAATIIGTLYLRSTLVLLPLLTNKYQVGYYAVSYAILSVLLAIPSLTVGAALPILARAARDDAERLRYVLGRLTDVMLIVGVWIALSMALGAGFAVQVLAAGKSEPSIAVIQIQAFAVITQFVSASWQYALLSLRIYRPLMWLSLAAFIVNLALTLLLVPLLQARGAALAFTCAEVLGAVVTLVVLVRARRTLMPSLHIPVRVLACAVIAGSIVFVPGLSSFTRTVIGSVLYFAALLALRAVPPEMLDALVHRPRAAHRG
jgi:O-antigen/teichoic acid export membrane protein